MIQKVKNAFAKFYSSLNQFHWLGKVEILIELRLAGLNIETKYKVYCHHKKYIPIIEKSIEILLSTHTGCTDFKL